MSELFLNVTIGDVARVRSGFAFKSKDWADHGVPAVKIANVKDGDLSMEGCSFVPQAIASTVPEWYLKRGDIVIAMTGYIGEVARVRDDAPRLLNQRVGRFEILDEARLDSTYFFYCLRDQDTRAIIEGLGYGSAQPNVSPKLIHSVEIPLPPLPEQRAIASILGALDDKIDLNRRMNETLEAMARAIFKSWFVDFDPVRAKAEGKQPFGMDADTAALFPDRLVDSEIGPVPEGWEVSKLREVLTKTVGGVWGEEERTDKQSEEVICLRGIDCSSLASGTDPSPPYRWISPKQLKSRLVESGDILVEGSGSFCGRSLMISEETSALFSHPVCYSNFVKRLRDDRGVPFALLASRHMQREYRAGAFDNLRTGSAFPNLDLEGMLISLCYAWPPTEIATAFAKAVEPYRCERRTLGSRTLAELRDLLLPKLLSGEIRVQDAEKAMEAAV